MSATEPPSEAAEAERHDPIFRLIEYAVAERRFIGGTLDALARARNPLLARLQVERTSRMPRTQITADSGEVVEQEPVQIRTKLTQSPQDIIDGNLEDLLVSLDQAANEYSEQFGKHFYEQLSRITEATGNVVNAAGRPFFDSLYEMYEKIDLQFDEEGRIAQELHLNPADVEKWQKGWAEMTPEQHAKLAALVERKRQEFNARRRNRRLPRRGN
jgi:hypothetical protein